MRYTHTYRMLLILLLIVVLLLLNLLLGSVSIPAQSIWNILTGTGNEPVSWQNIPFASGFDGTGCRCWSGGKWITNADGVP